MTSTAFATTIYKWVDSEGNVQYTQEKPPDADAEYTLIKPFSPINTEQAQKDLKAQQDLVDNLRNQRHKEKDEKQAATEDKARQLANCEKAKARLASYTKPRVKFLQEDGTRVRATEEERQQQIKKSQEMIKEFCK